MVAQMIVRIHFEPSVTSELLESIHQFLTSQNITEPDASWEWSQAISESLPRTSFPIGPPTNGPASLSVGFLSDKKNHNRKLLSKIETPMFLAGANGVPTSMESVAIPFEGKRFNAKWLRKLAERAQELGWPIRLLHGDHGLVAHEIMKLASWFHLDAVREAMKQWLTDDLEQAFQQFILDYPETEIKADIGKLRDTLVDEDPQNTLIMGCLTPGFHLLHHGINYSALLSRTGVSAYLLSD